MYSRFDADYVDWDALFESHQTGSNGYRAHGAYQRGSGSLSQLLGRLLTGSIPLLKSFGRAVGREALSASGSIANDLAAGRSFSDSFKENANAGYQNLVGSAMAKLDQSGSGVKRRQKRQTNTKGKTVAKKTKKTEKGGKKSATGAKKSKATGIKGKAQFKRDIFGRWPVS